MLVQDCAAATTPAEHASGVFNIGTYFGIATTASEVLSTWTEGDAVPTPIPETVSEGV